MECRWGTLVLCASTALLSACGGGGGGGNPSAPSPALTADPTTVEITAIPGDTYTERSVNLTVTNIPDAGLYVGGRYTTRGVESVDFIEQQIPQGRLRIIFRQPITLADGDYADTITLEVCHDSPCTRHIAGSPVTISTRFTVESRTVVALVDTPQPVAISLVDPQPAPQVLRLSTTDPPAPGVYWSVEPSSSIGGNAGVDGPDQQRDPTFTLSYSSPLATGVGRFPMRYTVRACYDAACQREVTGSPILVDTSYTVALAEPGFDPLPVLERRPLDHDVIDAEYSAALDAIVMVASVPENALHVYEVSTGAEHRVPLDRRPVAVSLSPSGLEAAVGHDFQVTHVADLGGIVAGAAPAVRTLPLSIDVADVVLDGRGKVHAAARTGQFLPIATLDIASGSETPGSTTIREHSRLRLHPDGDTLYSTEGDLSSNDVYRHDVSGGAAIGLYDSPYVGEHRFCGNLWFDAPGQRIFTPCGPVLRASPAPVDDLTYLTDLALSPGTNYGYVVQALSASAAAADIVLVEQGEEDECRDPRYERLCLSHVRTYDGATLASSAAYSIPTVEIDDDLYLQRGRFVFHRADGSRRYLITRLAPMNDTEARWYLNILP